MKKLSDFVQPNPKRGARKAVTLDPTTYDRIAALAAEHQTSMSKLVTAIVKLHDANAK